MQLFRVWLISTVLRLAILGHLTYEYFEFESSDTVTEISVVLFFSFFLRKSAKKKWKALKCMFFGINRQALSTVDIPTTPFEGTSSFGFFTSDCFSTTPSSGAVQKKPKRVMVFGVLYSQSIWRLQVTTLLSLKDASTSFCGMFSRYYTTFTRLFVLSIVIDAVLWQICVRQYPLHAKGLRDPSSSMSYSITCFLAILLAWYFNRIRLMYNFNFNGLTRWIPLQFVRAKQLMWKLNVMLLTIFVSQPQKPRLGIEPCWGSGHLPLHRKFCYWREKYNWKKQQKKNSHMVWVCIYHMMNNKGILYFNQYICVFFFSKNRYIFNCKGLPLTLK